MSVRLAATLAALGLALGGSRAAERPQTSALDAIPTGASSVMVASGPFPARSCAKDSRSIDAFRCATLAPVLQLSDSIARRLARDQLAWSFLALSDAWSGDLASAGPPPPDDESAVVEFAGGVVLACVEAEACSVPRLTRGAAVERGRLGTLDTWSMKSEQRGARLPVILANPRPGILVAAYATSFVREIGQKLATRGSRSDAPTLPEARLVHTDAPIWGARHFPSGTARREMSWEFDEVDNDIVGFAFQVSPDEAIEAFWVSPDTKAVERLSKALEGSALALTILEDAHDRTRFRVGCTSAPTCDAPVLVLTALGFPS
jgi:hypothetical protein